MNNEERVSMAIERVAILSPGDMGHAVGMALRQGGLEVITCLAGRSERTRGLAEAAGIVDVPDMEVLVEEADLVLSIMVPSQATALSQEVERAIRTIGARDLLRRLQRYFTPNDTGYRGDNLRGWWMLHRRVDHRRSA